MYLSWDRALLKHWLPLNCSNAHGVALGDSLLKTDVLVTTRSGQDFWPCADVVRVWTTPIEAFFSINSSSAALRPLQNQLTTVIKEHRHFWGWLNTIFNKLDENRIKEVGADRAAAEWLLRCGAHVKWKNFDKWHTDYNSLPGGGFEKYKIEAIYGDNAAIMRIGFPHLKGLKHLKTFELRKCGYIDNECMKMLSLVKESLNELSIISCGNVTDEGIKSLPALTNLKRLNLVDLPYVKNHEECLHHVQTSLPNCQIHFPPFEH